MLALIGCGTAAENSTLPPAAPLRNAAQLPNSLAGRVVGNAQSAKETSVETRKEEIRERKSETETRNLTASDDKAESPQEMETGDTSKPGDEPKPPVGRCRNPALCGDRTVEDLWW